MAVVPGYDESDLEGARAWLAEHTQDGHLGAEDSPLGQAWRALANGQCEPLDTRVEGTLGACGAYLQGKTAHDDRHTASLLTLIAQAIACIHENPGAPWAADMCDALEGQINALRNSLFGRNTGMPAGPDAWWQHALTLIAEKLLPDLTEAKQAAVQAAQAKAAAEQRLPVCCDAA
jgi:hypothetical protein